MSKFRKKPVVIDAIQWTGTNFLDCGDFLGGEAERNIGWAYWPRDHVIAIGTLEGMMRASCGDWIIKGVKGEFYPCKPDIFEATYELVKESE
jgi:hypothetical protein